MKLSNTVFALIAATFVSASYAEQPQQAPSQANCELRLVTNAGAGEVFMSIFTSNEEECLAKSDQAVEAKFRANGEIISRRGGKGPKP